MRDTIARFRARTGRPYRAHSAGSPLAPDEPCPTLFRFPGAGPLHRALTTTLARLGPPESETLWLCENATAPAPGGAGLFGALAVLEPLALGAARHGTLGGAHVYAADNVDVDPDGVVWIPPRLVAAGAAPWDEIATAAQAQQALGPGWLDERAAVVEALSTYLEELAELAASGAAPPARPWCEMDAAERARILAERGVTGRFTR